jgi:hypothetical protein
MCRKLWERSLIDKLFVFVYCNSSNPVIERSVNKDNFLLLKGLEGIGGDMQVKIIRF